MNLNQSQRPFILNLPLLFLLLVVIAVSEQTEGGVPDDQIPRIIIQTGPRTADFIQDHPEWIRYQYTIRTVNPNFNVTFLDDEAGFALIDKHFNHTNLPEVVRRVPRAVMRGDLIRLAAIAVYGGFYMDLDMFAKSSLEPLVIGSSGDSYTAVFPKEWWRNDAAYFDRHLTNPQDEEDRWQVGNYAFAAVAGHEFIWDALEEAMKRCMEWKPTDVMSDLDLLRTTGPYMLSEVYQEGRKQGRYTSVLHLPGDNEKPRRDCGPFCGENDWHKFGPYAEHMLTHSWVSSYRQLKGSKGMRRLANYNYDPEYDDVYGMGKDTSIGKGKDKDDTNGKGKDDSNGKGKSNKATSRQNNIFAKKGKDGKRFLVKGR